MSREVSAHLQNDNLKQKNVLKHMLSGIREKGEKSINPLQHQK